MEFSAAVFKNPVQSGRFIGQDWRRFSPWVQYLMPMDYRSHFGGDFETHLDLLAESIQQQKVWARGFPAPLDRRRGVPALRRGARASRPSPPAAAREAGRRRSMQAEFEKVAPRLKEYAPELHDAITAYLKEPGDARRWRPSSTRSWPTCPRATPRRSG